MPSKSIVIPSAAFGTVAVTLPVFSLIDTVQVFPLLSVYSVLSIVYFTGFLS